MNNKLNDEEQIYATREHGQARPLKEEDFYKLYNLCTGVPALAYHAQRLLQHRVESYLPLHIAFQLNQQAETQDTESICSLIQELGDEVRAVLCDYIDPPPPTPTTESVQRPRSIVDELDTGSTTIIDEEPEWRTLLEWLSLFLKKDGLTFQESDGRKKSAVRSFTGAVSHYQREGDLLCRYNRNNKALPKHYHESCEEELHDIYMSWQMRYCKVFLALIEDALNENPEEEIEEGGEG